jgi:hypothetical protein
MAKEITVLQVLVSSPSDLSEEREIVAEAVEELNRTWRRSQTVQLNVRRWEIDMRPGLGTDAQAIINEQIGDDYDIFIGIMGAKFGSATPRAGSGTEEEFERAPKSMERKVRRVRHVLFQRQPARFTERN